MKSLVFLAGLALLLGLSLYSLMVGASHITLAGLWSDAEMREIMMGGMGG